MTDNAYDVPCQHATVILTGDGWECTNCEAVFIPAVNVQGIIEEAERQVDMAVHVASETAARILTAAGFARKEEPEPAKDEEAPKPWFFGQESGD